MSFVAVHLHPRLSLATDELLLPPDQAAAFDDAVRLAAALAALRDGEAARLAAAEAEARAAGHEQGRREAEAAARDEAAARIAEQVRALVTRHDAELAALTDQVVTLAMLVLRRVAASLPADDVVAALARQVVAQAGEGQPPGESPAPTLRLNPALVEPVQRRLDAAGVRAVCRGDERLAALDCVLETPGGRLLAGLETQLQRVQAALRQAGPG